LFLFCALSSATLRPACAVPGGKEIPRRALVRGGEREREGEFLCVCVCVCVCVCAYVTVSKTEREREVDGERARERVRERLRTSERFLPCFLRLRPFAGRWKNKDLKYLLFEFTTVFMSARVFRSTLHLE
jgi:hypothetical protein